MSVTSESSYSKVRGKLYDKTYRSAEWVHWHTGVGISLVTITDETLTENYEEASCSQTLTTYMHTHKYTHSTNATKIRAHILVLCVIKRLAL